MSEFDGLSAAEQITALRHLARAGFTAAVCALGAVVMRGLMSPDELNEYLEPILAELEQVKHLDGEATAKLMDVVARLKRLAAENWPPND